MNLVKASIKKRGYFNTFILIMGTVLYYIFRFFYDKILKYLSINNNYIVFYSNPDYSDNAKVLYEYINKHKENYEYYWFVDVANKYNNSSHTHFIKFYSKFHSGPTIKSLYYMSKSKYIFYTHTSPFNKIKPKKGQLIINLWHGCGYKNDVNNEQKYIEKNYFDYVLVPGPIFIDTKSKFFGCKKDQILPLGYPRYDIMLGENENTKKIVFKLKKDNKLIIWMPTFRKTADGLFPEENNNCYDMPLMNGDYDFITLNSVCKKNNILLCVKRHPFQVSYSAEKLKLSNIVFIDNEYFLKNNIELYSFLRYSDALITDYSSVAVDYLLLDKPIGFILADYKEYSKSRGFVFDNPLEYMPGYHIYTFDEFKNMLIDIACDKDVYKKDRNNVINKMHNISNNYCARIERQIFNKEE